VVSRPILSRREEIVFIRFVTTWVDPDSQEAAGLFMAAQRLEYWDGLPAPDRRELCRLQRWFGDNLKTPTRLRRWRKPHRTDRAISWFRESATTHLAVASELVTLLERNGVHIFTCRRGALATSCTRTTSKSWPSRFSDTDRRAMPLTR
jgi:hypothetical protein